MLTINLNRVEGDPNDAIRELAADLVHGQAFLVIANGIPKTNVVVGTPSGRVAVTSTGWMPLDSNVLTRHGVAAWRRTQTRTAA